MSSFVADSLNKKSYQKQPMSILDTSFWTERYEKGHTGWDIGMASPPLIEFCKPLKKDVRVLIPGAGNAYEYKALKDLGFTDVTVLDISPNPIEKLKSEFPESENDFILGDFFEHDNSYDLILEQTFFCALEPRFRPRYVEHMHHLLRGSKGILCGVLFSREFEKQGPPFGGTKEEYHALFADSFIIEKMEPCYNSIPPRAGSELFIRLKPKG